MLAFFRRVRTSLWRAGFRLSSMPNWRDLVREVTRAQSAGMLWVRGNVVGAPLEWSLLHQDECARVIADELPCAWSGKLVSGAMPVRADGTLDLSAYGVRCARCGVPLALEHAGMQTFSDVPSCPPCRRSVARAVAHPE
jgi:hypothetical protein